MQTASEGGRRGLKAPASRPETKAFGRRSHAVGGGRAPKPALGEARAAPTGAASRRLPPFRRRVPQRPPDRAGSALRPRTGRRPEAPQSQIYGLGEALPCPRGPGDTKQKTDGSGANSHLRSTPAPRVCGAARDRAAGRRCGRREPCAPSPTRMLPPGFGLRAAGWGGTRPSPGPALRDPPAPRRIPGSSEAALRAPRPALRARSSAPQSPPPEGPGPTGAPTCPRRSLGSPTPGSASARSPGPHRVEPAWGAQGRAGPSPHSGPRESL